MLVSSQPIEVIVLDSELQEIVCCMGMPVAGNPTQFMIEKAFAAAGLDWRYLTFEIEPEQLENAVRGMRAMRFSGATVTIPHREAVIGFLDRLSESADLMGAVSCICRDGNELVGENTDGEALVKTLRDVIDLTGKRVVMFGAGGAARSIAVELGHAGVEHILVVNRSEERGQSLVNLLNERVPVLSAFELWEGDFCLPDDADLVINATALGLLEPEVRFPLEMSTLQPTMVVSDVIFNPPQSWFMRQAIERGCKTVDGPSILVNQAAINFTIWTGEDPDITVMREAMEEFLEI